MRRELAIFALLLAVFVLAYCVDFASPTTQRALQEGLAMLQWYARDHTLACVVPAMFVAGAIATFFSPGSVLRHLGPRARRLEAYSVAATSGTVLAVCSCSVLPMFAGIYRVGAGLGPAAAFLYSGPAINVMAIFLTARVLGLDLGIARVAGAIGFAIVIGLLMAAIFRQDEAARAAAALQLPPPPPARRRAWQTAAFFAAMILFLVFADWANPSRAAIATTDGTRMEVAVLQETATSLRVQLEASAGALPKGARLDLAKRDVAAIADATPAGYEWAAGVHRHRWRIALACLAATLLMAWRWFDRAEVAEWLRQTWTFAKSIVPLLFGGVFVTGVLGALIPEAWVAGAVGGNGIGANLVASIVGALWYFATLTEIPILEQLLDLGMGRGPALALLLAGPALSLPSIAVIHGVVGARKTAVFVALVVGLSAHAGLAFGAFQP